MPRQKNRSQIRLDLGHGTATTRRKRASQIGPVDPTAEPVTAGAALRRIRAESRDESEKGRWFEQLFLRLALQEPEFEIDEIHRWPDWPERERLTGRDARDIGIDLVAKRPDSGFIAVQCKCYDDGYILGKRDINSFLAESQRGNDAGPVFAHPSVDGSKPAIRGHRKPGHFGRPETGVEFYFKASWRRKDAWTLVRQLRGPHLSTWA